MPSPGLVRGLSVPGGPGIRDDRGVAAGFEIPMFYDSMISKLIVWGSTRREAIDRLGRALTEYRVVGVKTTVPFFEWLVRQPEFIDGRFDTTYLDGLLASRKGEPFVAPSEQDEHDASIAAAIATWMRSHRGAAAPTADGSLWRSTARREGLR
jgi:acetyl/propionyl-CoA carboxylase alpha subunit